jgi:hypothetical protein
MSNVGTASIASEAYLDGDEGAIVVRDNEQRQGRGRW